MFLRVVKRAGACRGREPLRGERCPPRGQAGQAAIDSVGVLTLVVLVLGVVLASTTQVAADVEAQLLCAVESIGTEGGASCGEPSEGTGSEDDDDVVDPPSFAAQQSYYVTTEDGRVYQMELGGGGQLDPSLGDTGSQLDPSLGGPDERGADCDPVRG